MESVQAKVSRIRNLTHDVRELEPTLYYEPEDISFKTRKFISFDISKEGVMPDLPGEILLDRSILTRIRSWFLKLGS